MQPLLTFFCLLKYFRQKPKKARKRIVNKYFYFCDEVEGKINGTEDGRVWK
jgi:hypothetical protein